MLYCGTSSVTRSRPGWAARFRHVCPDQTARSCIVPDVVYNTGAAIQHTRGSLAARLHSCVQFDKITIQHSRTNNTSIQKTSTENSRLRDLQEGTLVRSFGVFIPTSIFSSFVTYVCHPTICSIVLILLTRSPIVCYLLFAWSQIICSAYFPALLLRFFFLFPATTYGTCTATPRHDAREAVPGVGQLSERQQLAASMNGPYHTSD